MTEAARTSSIAYSSRVTSWWAILGGLLAVILWIVFNGYYDFASVVIAVVFLGSPYVAYTSTRTTIGRDGVVVRFAFFGHPSYRYAMGEIRRADVVTFRLRPWRRRFAALRHPFRDRELLIRHGASLQLKLNDGKRVMITVEDPATAAGVVNGYLGGGRD
jgi:hypothetical protein